MKLNLNGKKIDINNIHQVYITDNSTYVSGKHTNGGCYSYVTAYKRIDKDKFRVEFYTSSEFPYSVSNGTFGYESSLEECETVLEGRLVSIIIENWNLEGVVVEIYSYDN